LSSSNNGFFPLIFTFVIIIIIILFRIRKVTQGTKVSRKRTIIFSIYYLAIVSFLAYNSFLIGDVSSLYIIPYSIVVIAAAYSSYKYSKRRLSFWKLPATTTGNSDDSATTRTIIYSKGGLEIYLLYALALTIRIAINFLFIGSEKLYFINNEEAFMQNNTSIFMPIIHANPETTTLAFVVTNLLLMASAGLLVGRNARVLKYYYQEKEKEKSVRDV
jgi:hypothetical protein